MGPPVHPCSPRSVVANSVKRRSRDDPRGRRSSASRGEYRFVRPNPVKRALREGQPQVGTWLSLGSVIGRAVPVAGRLPLADGGHGAHPHRHPDRRADVRRHRRRRLRPAGPGAGRAARIHQVGPRLRRDGHRRADGHGRRRGPRDRRRGQVPAARQSLGRRRPARHELRRHGRGLLPPGRQRDPRRHPDRAHPGRRGRRRDLLRPRHRRHLRRPERLGRLAPRARRHPAQPAAHGRDPDAGSARPPPATVSPADSTSRPPPTPSAGSPRDGSSSPSAAS